MNPPYDERLKIADIHSFYEMIGNTLKKNYAGNTAWIITANMDAAKHIGLRPSEKIQLFNGPLECVFLKFELYEGSMKGRKTEDGRPKSGGKYRKPFDKNKKRFEQGTRNKEQGFRKFKGRGKP